MKDDHTTNSHYLTYTFILEGLGKCTFWAWEYPSHRLSLPLPLPWLLTPAPLPTHGFYLWLPPRCHSQVPWLLPGAQQFKLPSCVRKICQLLRLQKVGLEDPRPVTWRENNHDPDRPSQARLLLVPGQRLFCSSGPNNGLLPSICSLIGQLVDRSTRPLLG